ncbi:AraC family transcriptional regulator [Novosphingobium sp. PC22D]|uniref:DUF1465 family protein n=1 Tax=Novosphingobium sp. PC22D TaxID=1962403 RepID=UPI000BEFB21E|nr:DUF1465 family protein [Novosphingobium sp. PC22D]PEQ12778.1 AraC family transcriptional regulator [Novosphingobium sp. PC22D]
MPEPVTINPRIVEMLYSEALVLADEVRAAFAQPGRHETDSDDEDLVRLALSSEGLRTTTRMMHAVAWLLNHRAHFMGELSEFQLRRHGKLSADMRRSDPAQLALLDPEIRALVVATERFCERLRRLDSNWRRIETGASSAIARLRERIEDRVVLENHG